MWINVLRPRPRPFKFGWVSISLSYAKISVSVPSLLSRLLSSNVILCDQYLLYVFMYSWLYNGAPQPCFSRCMVDCTLMTDQMAIIFVFHFIWGHVPGGWICYQYSNREGPLEISMKINPNIKTGTSLRLFATICDEICLLPSFNLILDIPISKLTELWL